MIVEVQRAEIGGTVRAPSSKSAAQRYIAAALLSRGITQLTSVSLCKDTEAALEITKILGAEVAISENKITVRGGFNPAGNKIFTGESGLSARMFTPIASIHSGEISINGEGSILNRPFDMVQAPLGALGVKVTTQNGYLPITVKGPLRGGRVTADGSLSSQFITGLLMALPYVEPDSMLEVKNLVSRPYVDLTLKILDEFGVHVVNNNYSQFEIKGGQRYTAGNFSVEGDWSGAAFLLVIGAIAGQVTVTGLDLKSPQADKAVLDALRTAGAEIVESESRITVRRGDLRAFEFDLNDCPDLAPPLTVLALACRGKTILKGAKRLAAKESNRGIALEETMNIIGGKVKNYGSSVEIEGGDQLSGGSASSFNDHRIAMALASAALLCKTPVRITGMECINKSYPGFMDDYISIGGNIKTI